VNFHKHADIHLSLSEWQKKIKVQFFWKQGLIFSTHVVLKELNEAGQNEKNNNVGDDLLTR